MSGETDLDVLLRSLSPAILPGEYVYLSFEHAHYGDHTELEPIASFLEQEGLTLVVEKSKAIANGHDFEGVMACITLGVHSSLLAVGLTAAITSRMTQAGISANVIAGFYHDHFFVPADKGTQAVSALTWPWLSELDENDLPS